MSLPAAPRKIWVDWSLLAALGSCVVATVLRIMPLGESLWLDELHTAELQDTGSSGIFGDDRIGSNHGGFRPPFLATTLAASHYMWCLVSRLTYYQ